MRRSEMLMFLFTVLFVYGSINAYLLRRGWQAFSERPALRGVLMATAGVLILAYPLGRIFEGSGRHGAALPFLLIGSIYMALMLYLFFFTLGIDLLRLGHALFRWFPAAIVRHPGKAGEIAGFFVLGAAILIVAGGAVNAARPAARTLDITVDKTAPGVESLNIVLASDIHLGLINRCGRLSRLVEIINGLNPDILVLPGDIVDESVPEDQEERMIDILRAVRAPLGIYAVLGNHEYYSGLEKSLDYLGRAGVIVLQDEAVIVGGAFAVIGRKDPTAVRMGDKRLPIGEILETSGISTDLPLILLDHQPFRLEEAEEAGIDLQLSGHTHAGQLFPLSLLNRRIYEQSWGYHRRGKTQYYISSGAGTWGPPVRTGSRSEVVAIRVTFKSPE
jgi:uncharacterized protein